MKDQSQIKESIERFQNSFWNKSAADRPPVGIFCEGIFLPIKYLRNEFNRPEIFPDDINPELIITDYEYDSLNRRVFSDDWIPFSAAWRGVPWLEAICGCPVRYSTGSLAPAHIAGSVDELLEMEIPVKKEWFEYLNRQTLDLKASAPDDCWISPSILRGSSDVIGALRGLTDFYCDLYDNIRAVDKVASKVNKLMLDVLKMHFSIVSPYQKGYGHIFGYWAPGKTICIQEDALGMCSPNVYKDVFMKYNNDVVQALGGYVLFHLHSTGLNHYKEVLQISGLAGIQIVIEQNGPSLRELIPVLKEILEKSRLIISIDHYFHELPDVLRQIPNEGLYILISDKFIKTENEFREFIRSNW